MSVRFHFEPCGCGYERHVGQLIASGHFAGREVALRRGFPAPPANVRRDAARAERLGYVVGRVNLGNHAQDVHDIHTSAPERQGKPMAEHYLVRRSPRPGPVPVDACATHFRHDWGCLFECRLVAYIGYLCLGPVALYSMIIGHAANLGDGVMWFLHREVTIHEGPRPIMYGAWSDGRDGLRFWKRRAGFRPETIEVM